MFLTLMTSQLEGTYLFLAVKTDHRVSRKLKLLSNSDLFLVYPNNEIRTSKSKRFDILGHHCDIIKHLLLL